MRYKVVLSLRADADLDQAFEWIAADSRRNAIRWYNTCINAINSLALFPKRCPLAPESDAFDIEIRQRLFGPYRILFTIRGRTVYVLHVRHGARRELESEEGEE